MTLTEGSTFNVSDWNVGCGEETKKKKDLGDFLEQILQVDWLKK